MSHALINKLSAVGWVEMSFLSSRFATSSLRRMSSAAAKKLEGKVAIVTASTDG